MIKSLQSNVKHCPRNSFELKFSVKLLRSEWKRGGDGNGARFPSTGKTKHVGFGNLLRVLGDVEAKQKEA